MGRLVLEAMYRYWSVGVICFIGKWNDKVFIIVGKSGYGWTLNERIEIGSFK